MIVSALLGTVVGVLAGLFPGFHTNLIAVIVAGLQWDVWFASVFLIAVAVSRSIIDAVPTVFLGVADEQNVMALLPGHKLLKKGCGIDAVKFQVLGSILGIIGGVLLIPVFLFSFPRLFSLMNPWMFWILAALVIVLLVRDSWWGVVVFAFAGILGVIALQSAREPLFPLLSGLFGASGLLLSLFDDVDVPEQFENDVITMRKAPIAIAATIGILAGSIVTLFPGMSPSQAAALAQVKHQKSLRYLIVIGALGTVDVLISLVTFFTINKTRNGAVAVIEQLAGSLSQSSLFSLVAVACFAAGLAAVAALWAAKWYALLIECIEYAWITSVTLVMLVVMCYILSGWLGLLVFITATAVGLLAPLLGVSRSHAMGCLLVPTLLLLW